MLVINRYPICIGHTDLWRMYKYEALQNKSLLTACARMASKLGVKSKQRIELKLPEKQDGVSKKKKRKHIPPRSSGTF